MEGLVSFHFSYPTRIYEIMKNIKDLKLFLILVLIIVLGSCSSKKNAVNQASVVYPAAPDTARVQYLTSISNSDNTSIQRSAFAEFVVGKQESKQIKKPYGAAIRNGKIYVCDSGLGGLEIIDLEKKSFDYFLPEGPGQLSLPLNCFVEEDGSLYVADGERKQIVVFNSEGNYITCFGETENFRPTDVFIFGEKVWVASVLDNKVYVYDKGTYRLLYSFPDAEKGAPGFLYQPTNLFVTHDRLYVSDMGDFNIKVFSHDGQFLSSFGSHGTQVGQFVRPKGIAVDRDSNIFVVDAGFENAQIFNPDGNLLLYFGGPYKGPGDMWLPAKVVLDYDNLPYFQKYVDPGYDLKYLILVTNQYGPDKLNIYGAVEIKK
jgi:DNA-binding beta-propeller fold protein YncE